MKIVVCVRTRNEHDNIRRFCASYKWANTIIVSDGGSTDDTVALASQYHNVVLRPFTEKVDLQGGRWRNNDSKHLNFLFAQARELKADWIISDDCDMAPNYLLRQDARDLLLTEMNYAFAVRLYLWENDLHFPHMAKIDEKHERWETTLWAWRGNQDLWTVDDNFPHYSWRIGEHKVTNLQAEQTMIDILPPYCLLHYSWVNKQKLDEKIAEHRLSGSIPDMAHPLEFAGPVEKRPEWAHL